MMVIDWLQTSDFIRQNSERFVLYGLCGCFIGIAIILLTVTIVLYWEKRHQTEKNDYQSPKDDFDYNEILTNTRSVLPVYHYDGRTSQGFYHV